MRVLDSWSSYSAYTSFCKLRSCLGLEADFAIAALPFIDPKPGIKLPIPPILPMLPIPPMPPPIIGICISLFGSLADFQHFQDRFLTPSFVVSYLLLHLTISSATETLGHFCLGSSSKRSKACGLLSSFRVTALEGLAQLGPLGEKNTNEVPVIHADTCRHHGSYFRCKVSQSNPSYQDKSSQTGGQSISLNIQSDSGRKYWKQMRWGKTGVQRPRQSWQPAPPWSYRPHNPNWQGGSLSFRTMFQSFNSKTQFAQFNRCSNAQSLLKEDHNIASKDGV